MWTRGTRPSGFCILHSAFLLLPFPMTLLQIKHRAILDALSQTAGNKKAAARALQVGRQTFYNLLKAARADLPFPISELPAPLTSDDFAWETQTWRRREER